MHAPQRWLDILLPFGMLATTFILNERLRARKLQEAKEAPDEGVMSKDTEPRGESKSDPFDLLSPDEETTVRRPIQGAYSQHPELIYDPKAKVKPRNTRKAQQQAEVDIMFGKS